MSYILGIDEVGRGAWAGPLVVGAVILDKPIIGLKDSKLLTRRKRRELARIIAVEAVFCGLGWAEAEEIDEYGLSTAHILACRRAIKDAPAGSRIIIDGNINYLSGHQNSVCLIKADQTVPAVSAASIIAKVARDNYMAVRHSDFPAYNFSSNVGYGTTVHRKALLSFGPSLMHRRSFKPVSAVL